MISPEKGRSLQSEVAPGRTRLAEGKMRASSHIATRVKRERRSVMRGLKKVSNFEFTDDDSCLEFNSFLVWRDSVR